MSVVWEEFSRKYKESLSFWRLGRSKAPSKEIVLAFDAIINIFMEIYHDVCESKKETK